MKNHDYDEWNNTQLNDIDDWMITIGWMMNEWIMIDDVQQLIYPVTVNYICISNLKESMHIAKMPS